ncbi:phosphatase PAP2 family protein [uncultured Lutibacter sp.]|uniref:phosphatase PAP2 family protein n=1 Tax=uncultured Lutibacter sp. TaxID=437739 RepID=UPI00262499B8|nr:phosphatase PAP2 family protein [uncultured Lutibacter sp.]
MFDSIISKDIELLIYLNNLGTIQWDGFWLVITNKFSAIPLYFFLLYITYKQFGVKKTFIVVLFVILLIAISDQTSNLFKYGFKRLRPCHNENISHLVRLVGNRCGGLYSYFSAHAANSMAIAIFFGLLLKSFSKYLLPILVLWAFIVAYSRIYIGVHFPLDVVTGLLFGVLYATIIYYLLKMLLKKFMN